MMEAAEKLFCAAFIFSQHTNDDSFKLLDDEIAAAALASPGFAGKENWFSRDGTRINASYYWRSMEELQVFSRHPVHREAKRRYKEWYDGFHIVISEIVRSYGDGAFEHVTPNARARPPKP
ncbi:monooxygenase family protein [Devosia sp.]|uniref:monooxygenase family protein n=1 Tax=Devosia sp. TaxID=1871048 RepID=UPI00326768F0